MTLGIAILAPLLGCSGGGCGSKTISIAPDPTDSAATTEQIAGTGDPWLRDEVASPGSITFSEIHYHPASGDDAEWIELHNPMALDVDLSGWSLAEGVAYTFPEGTVIAAGDLLVVSGPWDGDLADDGETIELRNNGGRRIDAVTYGDDDPWPVAPDGSGLSLAKMDAGAASDHAESWTASAQLGGTPGEPNLLDPLAPATTVELVPLGATWRYDVSGAYPASDWASPDHDDGAWLEGAAVFYAGEAVGAVAATAWVTADNFYAIYLGGADGSDLRAVGEDVDGNWWTVDAIELEVSPSDHLYLAAWEAPGDAGGPQMTIAEVELPDDVVGTDATAFEWVLGPTDGCPGTMPGVEPPADEEIAALVASAAWAAPAVEADRASDPWGWALAGSFDAGTTYVWGDTFGDSSVTNTENTYALFRSVEPLLGPRGATELTDLPTTTTFRTSFTLDADPAAAELFLACLVDDGAVVYLNGVEVLRENVPDGVVDAGTLATAEVGDAAEVSADLAADALVRGENVLAVEVHQASPDDADLTFGCSLTARIAPASTEPTVVLNEIAPAGEAPFWVELLAVSAQDVGGLVLAGPGGETVLPAAEIAAGELFAVDDVGFPVESGDVLFLYSANRTALLDAARVGERARGRDGDAGPWRFPSEPTPGEPNVVELADDVVIHEIQYHHAPLSREGEPVTDDPEEWIELHNRGDAEVDLTGWQLVDAVAFAFPSGTVLAPGGFLVVAADAASLAAEHPGIAVVGDFSGRLDNGGDRVLLLDARGNPADEVRYVDGGRWPEAADGGGSSLELRDPRGDNAAAEAWAASDEGARAAWVTYRYRGVAEASEVGPDGVWNELVVGLLDAGEVLIDDVSVVRDPSTAAVELVEDGAFDGGGSWRLLGNHRHSEVVADPDDPSNPVLRLVATGPTGHVHNHAEITLPEAISAREYEISFRARWVSGSNQLHTRLYFNRLPRTTRVEAPTASGTPGEANSVAVENAGPTFADLAQEIAVPSPGEPVTIGVSVDDPDGVAAVTLWSAVAGGQFEAAPMTEAEPGRWEAALEGQEAGTIVQFFVEAEDARGATASFPAAGPDSRALVRFDDGEAATNGLHNLRILLTGADSDWLHADENLMSDDLVGATVVYDEAEVFHDVGVRLKGSERGRPEVPRLGYAVRFRDDQPFRGSHSSVLIDRSEGVGYGQREVLMNLVMTRAGSVHGEYNDLVHALTPLPEHTGPAELQLDRFSDLVLDAQFADGAAGTLFEYELVYYPLTTDDGTAEGQKLPQPDSVVGTSLTDLGDDPEAYRWTFLIQNNEREDDYDGILALCRTVGGDGFVAEADAVIDVEQWLRAFAFATLAGAVDNYGGDGAQHNARFYVRPEDGRVLYFPHDLDFFGGSTMAVVGNGDLARLLDDPDYARSYYGHLQDVVARAYDADSLAPWCAQLADLTGQDFDSHCQFVADRAEWVMNGSPDAVTARYPRVDFRITTNGGGDLAVDTSEIALEGEGWIDVRSIALGGVPLAVTWLDDATWRVTVPLDPGTNDVTLVAGDLHGEVVGTDTITVTSE